MTQGYLVCEAEFPTEGGWIHDEPDQANPPGRELAEFFRAVLRDRTSRMSEVWNEEGHGWSFNCDWDGITINVLIQRDDHWLIICSVVSLVPRVLRPRRYEAALSAACYSMDRAARSDGRFRGVQWFTTEEYARVEKGHPHG